MKDRSKSVKRIVEVQKKLYRLEELKYAQIQQRIAVLEQEQVALMGALSTDEALHGLFTDMTVKRLTASRHEVSRLVPELEKRARIVLDHAGRLRNAERLAEAVELDVRRAGERQELGEILDMSLARADASLKQDR
jgi:predicted TIM-barrel fold metal-dependent hydrolase